MDEYLKEHFVVKFLFFFLLGIGIFIFSYFISKSYKKEELEPTKENSYSRIIYWRSIGGMFLGIVTIIMSLYLLFKDLTETKENSINKIETVQIGE